MRELELLDRTEASPPWLRRRGVPRTLPSSGRSVVQPAIMADITPSWPTVLLELTSFTALLSSPLTGGWITLEDINVFTLP